MITRTHGGLEDAGKELEKAKLALAEARQEVAEQINQAYIGGCSISYIASASGFTRMTVYTILKEYGHQF